MNLPIAGGGRLEAVPLEVACGFIEALKATYLDHVSWPWNKSYQQRKDIFLRKRQVGALRGMVDDGMT